MILDDFIMSCPGVDAERGRQIVDRWNSVYPEMRKVLTEIIERRREEGLSDDRGVKELEKVRHGLGQIDQGSYKPDICSFSLTFDPGGTLRLVEEVLKATCTCHPRRGDMFRLAGFLSDLNVAKVERVERDREMWTERGLV